MSYSRRRFLTSLTMLGGALASPAFASSGLRFGIVPYLTARRLANLYQPMRELFEITFGRAVEISSAPSYAVHLQRLRAGEYDIVADSLPIARIAQRELGHIPVARTRVPLQPVMVTSRNRPLRSVTALRNGRVAVSDRLAALTLLGLRYLRDQGLVPGRDVRIVTSGSHANAVERLLAGDADAAVISRTAMAQLAPETVAQIAIVANLPTALSAVVYHVSPRLAPEAPLLTRAMIDFAERNPRGQTFIAELGHQGLLPVAGELTGVDPLVTEFYRQLSAEEE